MRSLRIALLFCLAAAAALTSGCTAESNPSQPAYRTINAPPLRDTEAAMRATEAGLQHLSRGDLDEAAKSFEDALLADVEFGPAHNNLGKVYFSKKEWYKAAWEFEYARKLLPRNAEPHNNVGLVYEEVSRFDEAVDCYREAIKLDSRNVEFRGNLARAMVRRGDRNDEVRSLLRQLIEQDDRPDWRLWASRQLAGMTGEK